MNYDFYKLLLKLNFQPISSSIKDRSRIYKNCFSSVILYYIQITKNTNSSSNTSLIGNLSHKLAIASKNYKNLPTFLPPNFSPNCWKFRKIRPKYRIRTTDALPSFAYCQPHMQFAKIYDFDANIRSKNFPNAFMNAESYPRTVFPSFSITTRAPMGGDRKICAQKNTRYLV